MTTTTTNTAAQATAEKTFVAFFTREDTKGPKVEIFKDMSKTPRAPLFSGKIGAKRVSFFLRKGSKGNFLGLVGDKLTDGSGKSEDLGTANVGTLGSGIPVMVIDFIGADGKKTPIFATISKKLSNEDLIGIGMNAERQAKKVADAASKKEAAPAVAKEATNA